MMEEGRSSRSFQADGGVIERHVGFRHATVNSYAATLVLLMENQPSGASF